MKRVDLIRHLTQHGCELIREGSRHSWWGNTSVNSRTAIPRHREIDGNLCRKICKDLGIPVPT